MPQRGSWREIPLGITPTSRQSIQRLHSDASGVAVTCLTSWLTGESGSLPSFEITLTFAFCSPIVLSGRGNGKRVARRLHCRSGSHESAAAR
jgi:hypothetical protein